MPDAGVAVDADTSIALIQDLFMVATASTVCAGEDLEELAYETAFTIVAVGRRGNALTIKNVIMLDAVVLVHICCKTVISSISCPNFKNTGR